MRIKERIGQVGVLAGEGGVGARQRSLNSAALWVHTQHRARPLGQVGLLQQVAKGRFGDCGEKGFYIKV